MTPASKEEIYLAKLCGEDWKLPYPASRLEYYYAKLCGMDVPLPAEPFSRSELYLAYLCGIDVKLLEPVSRKEMYMAKACGMDVEKLPEPLSRVERYWCIYVSHMKELIHELPLVFTSNGSYLIDYRIDGYSESSISESDKTINCGDKTKNLLPIEITSQTIQGITFTVQRDRSIHVKGTCTSQINLVLSSIELTAGEYCLSGCPSGGAANRYRLQLTDYPVAQNYGLDYGNGSVVTLASGTYAVRLMVAAGYTIDQMFYPQLEHNSEVSSYEPYGYKLLVECCAADQEPIITPVYIGNEPLKEGEYIHYLEQKRYYANHTSATLVLPPLPTIKGTMTVTVCEEVKPSQIYVKYISLL